MLKYPLGRLNFGTIEINWNTTPPELKLEVRDENGLPVTGVNISLSLLQVPKKKSEVERNEGKYQKHCSLEVDLPWIVRYRLAIICFGAAAGMEPFLFPSLVLLNALLFLKDFLFCIAILSCECYYYANVVQYIYHLLTNGSHFEIDILILLAVSSLLLL